MYARVENTIDLPETDFNAPSLIFLISKANREHLNDNGVMLLVSFGLFPWTDTVHLVSKTNLGDFDRGSRRDTVQRTRKTYLSLLTSNYSAMLIGKHNVHEFSSHTIIARLANVQIDKNRELDPEHIYTTIH